jgi:hypothetical protein
MKDLGWAMSGSNWPPHSFLPNGKCFGRWDFSKPGMN